MRKAVWNPRVYSPSPSTPATGDLAGKIKSLGVELKRMKYPQSVDLKLIATGHPAHFLPILHHILLCYSKHVARKLSNDGYQIISCTDQKFVESVFKFMRNEFGFKPHISERQFFQAGYAEHKIILVLDLVKACRNYHKALEPQSAQKRYPFVGPPPATSPALDTQQGIAKTPGGEIKWDFGQIAPRAIDLDYDLTPIPISKLPEPSPNSPPSPAAPRARAYDNEENARGDRETMARIEKLINEGFANMQKEIGDLKRHVDSNFFLIDNRLKFLDARVTQMASSTNLGAREHTP